jgi:protein involved in polysaccharide export with SLBB domain
MMKLTIWIALLSLCGVLSRAAEAKLVPAGATNTASAVATNSTRRDYVLAPTDVVQVKVYQEDDLDAKVRVSQDGSVTLPLLGQVNIGGKTREQAAMAIRDKLAEKYLVNPQVTLDVIEYSKRRFTVLGQVQRPGTYEFPSDQSVNLLQALSMAGGYTRLGAASKVTVQRGEGRDKKVFKLDADSMAKEASVNIFEVQPDDTISVGEKIF